MLNMHWVGCKIFTRQGSKWNGGSTDKRRVCVHEMHFFPLKSPRANEMKTAESMVNVEGGGKAMEGITRQWRQWDGHALPSSRLEWVSVPWFVWQRLFICPKKAVRPLMLSQMSHRMRRDGKWFHAGHAERQTMKQPQSFPELASVQEKKAS